MHPVAIVALVFVGLMVIAIGWLMWENLNDVDDKRYGERE